MFNLYYMHLHIIETLILLLSLLPLLSTNIFIVIPQVEKKSVKITSNSINLSYSFYSWAHRKYIFSFLFHIT